MCPHIFYLILGFSSVCKGKNINHTSVLKLNIQIFKYFFLNITLFACACVFAQVPPLQDTTRQGDSVLLTDSLIRDSLQLDSLQTDSLQSSADSLTTDTTRKEGLESPVNSTSADSTHFDYVHNVMHFYGDAKIKYQEFELNADYIRVDQSNQMLFARGSYDKEGNYSGRPIFKMQNEPPNTTDSMFYNFKSKRAKVFGVATEVEGGFIQARQLRKNEYDEASIRDATYSTCNLMEPHTHFGVHISKGVVSEKNIVTGPAYLIIEDVPLPFIAVPFGFFPKSNKRSSGFQFPTFGEDGVRGFFMRDIGWYFGLSDYWDAEVRGTLYSKGSYEGSVNARYRKNYKYDGGVSLRYARTRNGLEGTDEYKPQQDFNITWNHSQRQEANPGTSFSASVNVGTGSYFQNTGAGGTYDYDQITRNSMSSSISYGKVFGDGRFNFTSSLSHRQDITNGTVYLELPSFNFSMASFNPFDSKDRIGEQKWYQKINVGYSMQGRNSIDTREDLLFKSTLNDFQSGIQHNIPVSMSLNVLRYFNFNSSVNYTERWYFKTIRKHLDNTPGGYTTLTDTIPGFSRAYDYSLSSGFSTKIYGQKNFKGKLAAIRHVISPSVNFNYRPDFSESQFGFYRRFINADGMEQQYSIYEGAVFGGPGRGRSMGIGFSIDNNIEAKVRTEVDSTNEDGMKKVPIIQGLSFTGNYNFVADSFRMSNISFSGRTSLFDQRLGINFNGSFDPYVYDSRAGRRVDRFMLEEGKLARLTNFGVSMDFSLNSDASESRQKNLSQLDEQKPGMSPQERANLEAIARDPGAFVDFNVPWNLAASFSFYYSKPGDVSSFTSTLNVSGDLSITPKWKIQYNTGYDFKAKKITLTQFNIYRDLHCWDMSFGWIPFGHYRSYTFTLKVKASILQDLKLTKRNDYYNSF